MLISEVLETAAELLSVPLEGVDWTAPEGNAKTLLSCYHSVENEIALDYFPLRKRETLAASKGAVYFRNFSEQPVDILRAADAETGVALPWKIGIDRLILPETCKKAEIEYSYSPKKGKADGETPFPPRISARLLAYGTANEFCLLSHRYEEAKVWGIKYCEALRAAGILRRALSVRSRRWV